MADTADYDFWRRAALIRGWTVAPADSPLAAWHDLWVRYWIAMDNYERAIAAGELDPGRPVPPHRSASFHG